MSALTKAEKVNIINSFNDKHKLAIRKAVMESEQNGMGGAGFMDFLKGVGSGLLEIIKLVGPTLVKEVIVPMAKKKAGLGMKKNKMKKGGMVENTPIYGGAISGEMSVLTNADVPMKKGRGRPKKITNIMEM